MCLQLGFYNFEYHLSSQQFLFNISSMSVVNQNLPISIRQPIHQYSIAQNLGLPINSRLISESGPNLYFNSYQNSNQVVPPQQVYLAPSHLSTTSNAVYQSGANGAPIYNLGPRLSSNNYQQSIAEPNLDYQMSSRKQVGYRLVPVTQYVPVFQAENVQINNEPSTVYHRTILHEPEAFKQREILEDKIEKVQAAPMVEERRYEEQTPRMVNTKIVKVSKDPLVQTVQGGWRSKVSASRTSYVAPAPLPRQQKNCCSGWLLLLLGLIALGGILAAILIGKNSHSQQSNKVSESYVSGTKVSSSLPTQKVTSVEPLTNASIEVKGTTAVTAPISVIPTTSVSVAPSASYVSPTDISVVAVTPSSTQPIQNYVKPQQISVMSVTPVVVPSGTVVTESQKTQKTSTSTSFVAPTAYVSSTSVAPTAYVAPTPVTPKSIAPKSVTPTTSVTPLNGTVSTSVSTTNVTSIQPIPANSIKVSSKQPVVFMKSEPDFSELQEDGSTLPAVEVTDSIQK